MLNLCRSMLGKGCVRTRVEERPTPLVRLSPLSLVRQPPLFRGHGFGMKNFTPFWCQDTTLVLGQPVPVGLIPVRQWETKRMNKYQIGRDISSLEQRLAQIESRIAGLAAPKTSRVFPS